MPPVTAPASVFRREMLPAVAVTFPVVVIPPLELIVMSPFLFVVVEVTVTLPVPVFVIVTFDPVGVAAVLAFIDVINMLPVVVDISIGPFIVVRVPVVVVPVAFVFIDVPVDMLFVVIVPNASISALPFTKLLAVIIPVDMLPVENNDTSLFVDVIAPKVCAPVLVVDVPIVTLSPDVIALEFVVIVPVVAISRVLPVFIA